MEDRDEILKKAEEILAVNLGMAEIITRKAFESGIEFVSEQFTVMQEKPPAYIDILTSHLLEIYVSQFIKSLQGR